MEMIRSLGDLDSGPRKLSREFTSYPNLQRLEWYNYPVENG